MNNLNTFLICALIFLGTGFYNPVKHQYQGTNLRGRLVTRNYSEQVPVVQAKIDLYFFNGSMPPGSQWILLGTSYTDAYGFYYFRLVPPAYYTLQINHSLNVNIRVVPIDYRFYTYQDIQLINL